MNLLISVTHHSSTMLRINSSLAIATRHVDLGVGESYAGLVPLPLLSPRPIFILLYGVYCATEDDVGVLSLCVDGERWIPSERIG